MTPRLQFLVLWLLAVTCSAALGASGDAIIRVRTVYPTGHLRLWVSDDGNTWRFVDDSTAHFREEQRGLAHGDYLFPLPYLPAYVRVGVTGALLGRLSVDSIEGLVGGEPHPVLEYTTAGTVLNPLRVRERDDQAATIVHRGQEEVVTGFILQFEPTGIPLAQADLPTRYGVYTGPRDGSDDLAQAIAWWDFTIFQQGKDLATCVRKVKAINPEHRVILRLMLPGKSFLRYAYDLDSRRAIRREVADCTFGDFAELVDTVTLSEEEPGNMFKGIYGTVIPPEEIYFWKHRYEEERGQPFTWPPSPDVNIWMGEKFQFMLNDLYDYIHAHYPHIKVYQWVELRGFGNRSGFPEYVDGDTLKMDGFVLEWSRAVIQELIDSPLGKEAIRTSFVERYMTNLEKRCGVTKDEILGQAWAFDPNGQDTLDQVEALRQLGIPDVYFFFPAAATPGAFSHFGADGSPPWEYAEQVWRKLKPMIESGRN